MENAEHTDSKLCINGCGFFGNPMTGNMCSKCHKALEKESRQRSASSSAKILEKVERLEVRDSTDSEASLPIFAFPEGVDCSPSPSPVTKAGSGNLASRVSDPPGNEQILTEDAASALTSSQPDEEEEEENPRPVQVKKNRCWSCSKKVGLLGYDCRCGYIYCAQHRYAEDHECDYNFKEAGRQYLTEQNPEVRSCKITKI